MTVLRLATALLWAGLTLTAQLNTGQISGKIFDTSGAVVPLVSVTVTSDATSAAQTTMTDAGGYYSFPSLARGSYKIRASKEGFRPTERSGVVVEAASR